MVIRLVTPGLFSGSTRISPSLSVTARRSLRRTSSGVSAMLMKLSGSPDLLILLLGSLRAMMRAAADLAM